MQPVKFYQNNNLLPSGVGWCVQGFNSTISLLQASKLFTLNKKWLLKLLFKYFRIARDNREPNEDGKYGEITTIPIKKGPATALSPEIENKIHCFIEDTYHMGLPRCKGR